MRLALYPPTRPAFHDLPGFFENLIDRLLDASFVHDLIEPELKRQREAS